MATTNQSSIKISVLAKELKMKSGKELIEKLATLGFGDVKLFAVCGLFLGVKSLILSLIISSVIASVVLVIVSKIKKKEKGTEYPFGPFITVAVLISVFVGEYIVNADCEQIVDRIFK